MIRTQKGRVVYERKRHFFNARDLLRIARAMPPPENVTDAAQRFLVIGEIYLDILEGAIRALGPIQEAALKGILAVIRKVISLIVDTTPLGTNNYERLVKVRDSLYLV